MAELPTPVDALHAQGNARGAAINSVSVSADVQPEASKYVDNSSDSTEEDDDRNDDSNRGCESSQPPSHAPRIRRKLKANTITACTNANRPVVFQSTHALKFGLEVVARDAETSAVTSALCLFCKHFGREPRPGAKRRATTNFKYFKGTFRTDQYLQHHRLQHPAKWMAYEAASVRDKQVFFPRHVMAADVLAGAELEDGSKKPGPKAKRLRRVSGEDAAVRAAEKCTDDSGDAAAASVQGDPNRSLLQVDLPASIVALFLGESSWEPRSLPSIERGRTPLVENGKSTQPQDVFKVPITDRVAFEVAVDLCASGLSSRQTACAMHAMAKYVPHGAGLGSVWDELVQNYTQVATFGSLAMVSKLITKSWAFSIGLHRSHGDEIGHIIDVRVRVADKTLDDLHLCRLAAAPGREDKLVRVLDVVYPHWASSLIAISVDGDVFASPSAVVSTIRTLRSRAATDESTFHLVWNGHTLLARGFRDLFGQLMDGAFAPMFHQLKSYIKSQSALIQEIGHEPHAGRALSNQTTNEEEQSLDELITTARWICEKRVRIRKYLEEEQRGGDLYYHNKSSEVWWLCLSVFDWIASATLHASSGLRSQLRGEVLTTEQPKLVQELIVVLSTAFKVTTTRALVEMPTVNTIRCLSARGDFATTKRSVLEFAVDLGSFVNGLMAGLHDGELDVLVKSLGSTVSTYVETLTLGLHTAAKVLDPAIATGSGASELVGGTRDLPMFPQDLAKCGGKAFATLVGTYRSLLLSKFSEEDIDAIEQEHQALKRATREKEFPSWAVDTPRDRLAVFDAAWARTLGRFRMLHAFAAGLATVFPRDDSRRAHTYTSRESTSTIGSSDAELLDLRIEAPLHATQFHRLQRAVASVHSTPHLL